MANTRQENEFACANYWKQSWSDHKWNPVMLNNSHAQASNLYGKLQQKLVTMMLGLPSELTTKSHHIAARFTRWCALHAAGGGWMSDYDVVNLGLTPSEANKLIGSETLNANKGSAHLIYATKEHAEHAIKKFIATELIKNGEVASEAAILGIKNPLNAGKLIKHAKATKTLLKADVMKNLLIK
jgi:hypothetical protein